MNSHFPFYTCKLSCCKFCTYCTRAFTKERYKSWHVRLLSRNQIKICERCFCVDQLSYVKPVTKAQHAVSNLPLGARLQNFSKAWETLGAGLNLTRSPTIIGCYANPHRNLYLLEALHQLIHKNAVELITTKNIRGFTTNFSWSQNQTTNEGLY